jgi:hypothetical protein
MSYFARTLNKPLAFIKSYRPGLEFFFFLWVLAINTSLLFSFKYFPTYDGGAHAYNTTVLRELLFNPNSVFHNYFAVNSEILPNYLSNAILLALDPFCSFHASEKILLALFFIGVPLTFRSIVKKLDGNIYLSYLIFPFVHNDLLYMGFFNYTIGILTCLIAFRVYLNLKDNISWKMILLLFVCFGLAYFAHLFTFIVMIILMGSHSLMHLVLNFQQVKSFGLIKWLLNRAVNILIPLGVFLAFTAAYFSKRPSGKLDHLPVSELNSYILDLIPLQAFGSGEKPFCLALFFILFSLFAVTLYHRISTWSKTEGLSRLFKIGDVFFALGLLFIYFIYTRPDKDGFYGYISTRFVFWMFLFFVFWMATNRISNRFAIALVVVYLFFSYLLFAKKKEGVSFLSNQLKRLEKPMQLVRPNSVVMQGFFADHYLWQGVHYLNYLGADKPVVLLENYEADIGYFPVIWKPQSFPYVKFGDAAPEGYCFGWPSGDKTRPVKVVDYFLLFGEKPDNECYRNIKSTLDKNYSLIYQSVDLRFYQLRTNM